VRKVIIELRCNEYAMRDANPHVPWTPEEIARDAAAAREAGAAILHYHARDPETGAPSNDVGIYADTVRRVRAASDLLITPTLGAYTITDPAERVAHIPAMSKDIATRPDFAPVDLASVNIDPYTSGKGFAIEDIVYATSVRGLRTEIEAILAAGVHVDAVLWNVGSARLLGAFLEMGVLTEPVLAEIALSELILATHPPTERGLRAMLDFLPDLPERREIPWLYLNVGGDALPLLSSAIELGGHVALGLGDSPYLGLHADGTPPTNAEIVAEAVRVIRAAGCEPATPDEARELLGL
jgi:3-keto-5-aminohexanoate cleavage enzyme